MISTVDNKGRRQLKRMESRPDISPLRRHRHQRAAPQLPALSSPASTSPHSHPTMDVPSNRLFRFSKPEWLNNSAVRNAGVYTSGALVSNPIHDLPPMTSSRGAPSSLHDRCMHKPSNTYKSRSRLTLRLLAKYSSQPASSSSSTSPPSRTVNATAPMCTSSSWTGSPASARRWVCW